MPVLIIRNIKSLVRQLNKRNEFSDHEQNNRNGPGSPRTRCGE